jgi:hypothetical protein
MRLRSTISAGLVLLFMTGLSAQDQSIFLEINDIEGVTSVVTSASSSSSSSCNSPDFPVLRGGSRKDVKFGELSWIIVLHDRPAKDPTIYIKVELTLKNGEVEEYEMIRNVRFIGKSGGEDFSILIEEINTVQIS